MYKNDNWLEDIKIPFIIAMKITKAPRHKSNKKWPKIYEESINYT